MATLTGLWKPHMQQTVMYCVFLHFSIRTKLPTFFFWQIELQWLQAGIGQVDGWMDEPAFSLIHQ